MLGLPTGTAIVLLGFPLFWIVYTAGFLLLSRRWKGDDEGEG